MGGTTTINGQLYRAWICTHYYTTTGTYTIKCTCNSTRQPEPIWEDRGTIKVIKPSNEVVSKWSPESNVNYLYFKQRLKPYDVDFSKCVVIEKDGEGGHDGCAYEGDPYEDWNVLKEKTGVVGWDNWWGPDTLGWKGTKILHFRTHPVGNPTAPCHTKLHQDMHIDIAFYSDPDIFYDSHTLRIGFTDDEVWARKGPLLTGVYIENTWPE